MSEQWISTEAWEACKGGDILDRIDAAIGCQQCGGPLRDSPSDDFCGEGCQEVWHEARADVPSDLGGPYGLWQINTGGFIQPPGTQARVYMAEPGSDLTDPDIEWTEVTSDVIPVQGRVLVRLVCSISEDGT